MGAKLQMEVPDQRLCGRLDGWPDGHTTGHCVRNCRRTAATEWPLFRLHGLVRLFDIR